ncbi:hypothetical protein Tco_0981784, partial [Tanacetum coccineum]
FRIKCRTTPAKDVGQVACSVYTIFVDVATSIDDVGVSEIRSSGGCKPHVVMIEEGIRATAPINNQHVGI